jgi:hypothetical protein
MTIKSTRCIGRSTSTKEEIDIALHILTEDLYRLTGQVFDNLKKENCDRFMPTFGYGLDKRLSARTFLLPPLL